MPSESTLVSIPGGLGGAGGAPGFNGGSGGAGETGAHVLRFFVHTGLAQNDIVSIVVPSGVRAGGPGGAGGGGNLAGVHWLCWLRRKPAGEMSSGCDPMIAHLVSADRLPQRVVG